MHDDPAPPLWKPLLGWLAGWMLLALLTTLAQLADADRLGQTLHFGPLLVEMALMYLCYAAYSGWFVLHARRHPAVWSSPRRLIGLYLLSMLVFVPLWLPYSAVLSVWANGKPWSAIWSNLRLARWYYLVYDAMLAAVAFAMQAGWMALQLARQRERAWRREQTDNLRLRLSLLQGQLEPHFLFNTLNGVSALVRAGDRPSASAALARVSELLRYALRASRSERVSVADEIGFARDYLQLQALRFGEGLQVDWQLGPAELADWAEWASPPLLLQPLLENAIRHGLEAHDGTGRIEVRLAQDGTHWQVEIDNDLPSPGSAAPGHGLGLSATRERLAMLYGDAAHLDAAPHDGRYRVRLRLPLIAHEPPLHRPHR